MLAEYLSMKYIGPSISKRDGGWVGEWMDGREKGREGGGWMGR